jgi:hypothetical protein
MAIGGTLLIVLLLVGAIWLFVEVKRFRHKAFALFLIVLILFTYLGFTATIKGKNIDLKTTDGIKDAGQFYLSWLGSIFSNFKTLTSNAVNMDWKVSENEMNYKTNTTGIFKK